MDVYSTSSTADVGLSAGIIIGALVFGLILYAVFAYFLGKIFKKAGEEEWKAWVPIYNQWVFLELGGQKGWLALLSLLGVIPIVGFIGSIVGLVFACIAAYHIGLKLQKEAWFVVLYILVTPVWIIWLAVDKSTWNGAAAVAAGAPTPPPYQQPVVPGAPAQPPAPETPPQASQPPVSQPPVAEQPGQNQNNTPPTPPVAL